MSLLNLSDMNRATVDLASVGIVGRHDMDLVLIGFVDQALL